MIELTAEVTKSTDHAEIHITGYLNSDSADRLDEAMKQVGDADRVVLIFDEQCHINSTGLSALFEHVLPGIEQGKEFRVVHPAPHFRKVFDIVGLSADVEVFADEASALAK